MSRPRDRSTSRKARPPLDGARLEELALAYVARFATSSGRLADYCRRKLRERGYVGQDDDAPPPDVATLVERFVAKGYVDDAGYARARADTLLHRGYGARRVGAALRGDGIAEPLRDSVAPGEAALREAAVVYARRRRMGPYARERLDPADRAGREKQLAAMLRAGHESAHARRVLIAVSTGELDGWIAEAREEEDRPA